MANLNKDPDALKFDRDQAFMEIQANQIKALFEAMKNDHQETQRLMLSLQSSKRSMEAQFKKIDLGQQQLLNEISKRNENKPKFDDFMRKLEMQMDTISKKASRCRTSNRYDDDDEDQVVLDEPVTMSKKTDTGKAAGIKRNTTTARKLTSKTVPLVSMDDMMQDPLKTEDDDLGDDPLSENTDSM